MIQHPCLSVPVMWYAQTRGPRGEKEECLLKRELGNGVFVSTSPDRLEEQKECGQVQFLPIALFHLDCALGLLPESIGFLASQEVVA